MKAVIMAGGKGTRLRPLTCNTPKPMVPLLNRPVMEYTIELLKLHQITDIVITVQYMAESIRNYFGDGSDFGVKLHYVYEDMPLGTAGSVKNAEFLLDDRFLVISGDALTDFNLKEAIRYHDQKNAMATLVLTQVEQPLEFGVVMTDEKGAICRFLEKPSWSEVFSDTVNTGIYIFEKEIFDWIDASCELDFSKDIFPRLLSCGQKLYGYVATGYWSDIGNIEQYRQAQFDLLNGRVKANISGIEVERKIWVSPEAVISKDATIEGPAWIGPHCSIEGKASVGPLTILGNGIKVRDHAHIERSILLENNLVESYAELKGATISRNCLLRRNCLVQEGVVVGDHCQIGRRSRIGPQIKIYPYKFIDHEAYLHDSLLWEKPRRQYLFGPNGIEGTFNLDLTVNMLHRLALSVASVLDDESTVCITHDDHRVSKLAAESVNLGLQAAGIHTISGGKCTIPAARYAASSWQVQLAIHLYVIDAPNSVMRIELMDDQGIPISKNIERAIQNSYSHEQFRKVEAKHIGQTSSEKSAMSSYVNGLKARFSQYNLPKSMSLKWVLEMNGNELFLQAAQCAVDQGIRLVHYQNLKSEEGSRSDLEKVVEAVGAEGAVRMNRCGTIRELMTSGGVWLSEQHLMLLQWLVYLHYNRKDTVNIPVYMPDAAEDMIRELDLKSKKVKADYRSSVAAGQQGRFHMFHDGFYFLYCLSRLLEQKQCSVTDLIQSFPSSTWLKKEVICTWPEKGKIMRYLMEEAKGTTVELIDGIKFVEEHGWTLVLPEEDRPGFHLYIQARTPDRAEELAIRYMRKIFEYRDCKQRVEEAR